MQEQLDDVDNRCDGPVDLQKFYHCIYLPSLLFPLFYLLLYQQCTILFLFIQRLRHEIEKWFGKPGSFSCLWSWKEHIKTGLIPPSTSASLWYLCGILHRFLPQGHHFVTSGLDLENMGLAMDSIQGSTVPGVWACLAVMSWCRKSMDLVTRVSWSHKSPSPPLHTPNITKIHMEFSLHLC